MGLYFTKQKWTALLAMHDMKFLKVRLSLTRREDLTFESGEFPRICFMVGRRYILLEGPSLMDLENIEVPVAGGTLHRNWPGGLLWVGTGLGDKF